MLYALFVLIAAAAVFGGMVLLKPFLGEGKTLIQFFRTREMLILYAVGTAACIAAGECRLVYSGGNFQSTLLNTLCMAMLFAMAISDAKLMRIPNSLCLAGLGIALIKPIAYLVLAPDQILAGLLAMLVGAAFAGGVFLLCALIKPGCVGMGDVKMFGIIGLLYGLAHSFVLVFFSLIFMLIVGVVLMLFKKANRKTELPMAPYAAASCFLAMILGVI